MVKVKAFINGRICFQGKELQESIYVNEDTGMIVRQPAEMPSDFVDLKGNLLAPAYLELQTNGLLGFHFTNWKDPQSYRDELERVSRHLVSNGVASFYVTLPTVHRDVFTKVRKCRLLPVHLATLSLSELSAPIQFLLNLA